MLHQLQTKEPILCIFVYNGFNHLKNLLSYHLLFQNIHITESKILPAKEYIWVTRILVQLVWNHLISVLGPNIVFLPTGVSGKKIVKNLKEERKNIQILQSLQTLKRPVLQSPPVWTMAVIAVLLLAPRTGCFTTAWAGAQLLESQGWWLTWKQRWFRKILIKPGQSDKETRTQWCPVALVP